MDARTDVTRLRRTYIMSRLQRAMGRLYEVEAAHDYVIARRWVNAWSRALGEMKFPAALQRSDEPNTPVEYRH